MMSHRAFVLHWAVAVALVLLSFTFALASSPTQEAAGPSPQAPVSSLPAASPETPSAEPSSPHATPSGEATEVNWLDEAEKGTPRDREIQGSFYHRIGLTIFALVVVSIVIYLFLRLVSMRRISIPSIGIQTKMIKVVERHLLQPQKALYLVDVAGKFVLIAVTDNQVEYLTDLEPSMVSERQKEIERDAAQPPAGNFVLPPALSFLNKLMLDKKNKEEAS
ncbi:MAG: flagellar biosynthetic protein FliO [Candidatus Eremiobacteraeota bacterium]|nr:flagellar biosynthetic protein FliO [Candidatus Eremiobacteraeota bacterium]